MLGTQEYILYYTIPLLGLLEREARRANIHAYAYLCQRRVVTCQVLLIRV